MCCLLLRKGPNSLSNGSPPNMAAFMPVVPLPDLSTGPRPRMSAAPLSCSLASPPSPRETTAAKPLSFLTSRLQALVVELRHVEQLTRPGQFAEKSRYDSLPEQVKSPSQMLGRVSQGCEGTNSVFPRCNFGCAPCYHSADANRVRVDGMHTITEVARQMDQLRSTRGPTGYTQLIGGEVSLLSPEDHALVLETMRFFGRIPMSFTHGDFSFDYLSRLALQPASRRPRFNRLDFAVHFDIGMKGRRGTSSLPLTDERELHPFRRRFVDMFRTLRAQYGVHYYLAHNMTVHPRNIDSLSDAVYDMCFMGFRLLSFQPAALQGARQVSKVHDAFEDDGDYIWSEIERGIGMRLSYSLFQMGDVRCNRMSILGVVGGNAQTSAPRHLFLLFDDQCPHDVVVRDAIFRYIGNIVLPPRVLVLKVTRVFLTNPWLIFLALQWCLRIVRRAKGLLNIIRGGLYPLTIVMHRFMDSDDVKHAWQFMQRGVPSNDPSVHEAGPKIKDTIDRLQACSYGMANVKEGLVVPACVQHSVYDPQTNEELAEELPLSEPPRPASDAKNITIPFL